MLEWWQIILILITVGVLKFANRYMFFRGFPTLLKNIAKGVKNTIKEGEKENGKGTE